MTFENKEQFSYSLGRGQLFEKTTFVKFTDVACHKPTLLLVLVVAFSTNIGSVLQNLYLGQLGFGGFLIIKRQL